MASQVDPDVFPDNVRVDKAELREQLAIIRDEITELQKQTSFAGRMAFSDADFDNL